MAQSNGAKTESEGGHLRGLPSRNPTTLKDDRVRKIRDMVKALLEETASLERERQCAEANASVTKLETMGSIDFFEEVRRFESILITRALELTAGNQTHAAKLLRLGTTTLNYKVKTYSLG